MDCRHVDNTLSLRRVVPCSDPCPHVEACALRGGVSTECGEALVAAALARRHSDSTGLRHSKRGATMLKSETVGNALTTWTPCAPAGLHPVRGGYSGQQKRSDGTPVHCRRSPSLPCFRPRKQVCPPLSSPPPNPLFPPKCHHSKV